MSNRSNVSLIALGISEVREGSSIVEGGIARIAEGVLESWSSVLRWSYGSGDDEVFGVFNLGDFYKPVRKPNGEEDTKAKSAKWVAVAECYGITGELTSADKMAFQRGFTIAAAEVSGVPVEFANVKVERKGKAAHVRAAVVPASVAFKLVDDEGKPSEIAKSAMAAQASNLKLFGQAVPEESELLGLVSKLPIECVGGRHPIFGKVPSATSLAASLRPAVVEAGLMPAAKQRVTEKRGAQFIQSAEFIVSCLDLLASDKGESEFAPSKELNAKLRAVAERIAAYFASDLSDVSDDNGEEFDF